MTQNGGLGRDGLCMGGNGASMIQEVAVLGAGERGCYEWNGLWYTP